MPEDRNEMRARLGPWAVIAGASDGTGAVFADLLAAQGINLVLVARREALLNELGESLRGRHGIAYRVLVQDLTKAGAGEGMLAATADLDVGLYVSNAGVVAAANPFLDTPLAQALAAVRMNVENLTVALHGFGERLRARGGGGMVVMASGAAFGGHPLHAMYSATKAFEVVLAEALHAELAPDGIAVLAVAAPAMDTPTMRRGRPGQAIDPAQYFTAEAVAQAALARLGSAPTIVFQDAVGAEEMERRRAERLAGAAEWARGWLAAKAAAQG